MRTQITATAVTLQHAGSVALPALYIHCRHGACRCPEVEVALEAAASISKSAILSYAASRVKVLPDFVQEPGSCRNHYALKQGDHKHGTGLRHH